MRAWLTRGSVAAAMLGALLWVYQLHLTLLRREGVQLLIVTLTYGVLWLLTLEPSARRP